MILFVLSNLNYWILLLFAAIAKDYGREIIDIISFKQFNEWAVLTSQKKDE